jgi:hypothetical protein
MKKLLFAVLFISAASLGWAQSSGSDVKKWEFQVQGGLSLPVSPYFAGGFPGDSAYKFDTGYNFGGAVGYKITPQVSVLADVEWHDFRDQYTSARYYFWNMTEMSFLLKYRILTGPLTPFVFAGPGIVINVFGYKYTGTAASDYAYGSSEVDALLQAGFGLEYAVSEDFSVFVQAKESFDFNGGDVEDWTYGADNPSRYVPVEAGLILNL